MIEKLLTRLRTYDTVSAAEEQALRDAAGEISVFNRGDTIVKAKAEQTHSNLLLEGVVVRHKDLRDGARQMLEVSIAGDFIDLHSFTMKRLDHDIAALSACRIVNDSHVRLRPLIDAHPHLGRLLWLVTMIDASIHREWMLSLGRRNALSRVANLFCELRVRLGTVGLAEDGGYALPLTQTDLSDLLGLTTVHVNRTLRELREQDILTFRSKSVAIHDWDRLVQAAEFDPFYLGLFKRPR